MTNVPKRTLRYAQADGSPLLNCPSCGHDLTESVLLDLDDIDGRHSEAQTGLDGAGRLVDTADEDVARGRLTETSCGNCGESISQYEYIEIEGCGREVG